MGARRDRKGAGERIISDSRLRNSIRVDFPQPIVAVDVRIRIRIDPRVSARASSPININSPLSLQCPRPHHAVVRDVPPKRPRDGRTPMRRRSSSEHVLVLVHVGPNVSAGAMVMLLVLMVGVVLARATHLVQVRTARPTPRRAWHRSDERRAVRNRALQGRHREDRHRRRGRGGTPGRARTRHGVCAARARGAMMVLLLVLHGRCGEVKRWTFLTERWRRSRRGFVREEMMIARARGG